MSLQEIKKELRQRVFAQRKSADSEKQENWNKLITSRVLDILTKELGLKAGDTVYSYMDFRGEAGTAKIHEALWELGIRVAVPKTYGKDKPMRFFYIEKTEDTEEGNFHVPEPKEGLPEAHDSLAPVIVPGVVFSRDFTRIGYGAGFYDRFFSAEPEHRKIAICFPFQLEEKLTAEDHDFPMDMIVTPEETIRRFDAILFDMDGTLIDTEKYYRIAWPAACRDLGYEMSDEQALTMRSLGKPWGEMHIKEMFGEEADRKAIRERREIYMQEFLRMNGIQPMPYAKEALMILKKAGYRLAVTTASDLERTERYLKAAGLYEYFDDFVSATQVAEGKPSPDVYLYACDKLGIRPCNTLVVEDAPNGIKAAYSAGAMVCMIPDQSQPDEDLNSLLYVTCDNLQELAKFVAGERCISGNLKNRAIRTKKKMFDVSQKADLHLHSTASDGSDRPEELVNNIRNAGISIFALTDHDTVKGVKEVLSQDLTGLAFVPGVEFSCINPYGKCHIIGFGCDMDNPSFQELLNYGTRLRKEKYKKRLIWLKEQFQIEFSVEALKAFEQMESVGKPHLAQELIRMGYAETVDEGIRKYFDGLKEKNDKIPSEKAIAGILTAGGIPVWAHPLGGEGERHLTEEEFRKQRILLQEQGMKGMECYYSRYSIEECKFLKKEALENGILMSGGSDYHGKVKTINIGELNREGVSVNAWEFGILNLLI